jgi:hypothetical protein
MAFASPAPPALARRLALLGLALSLRLAGSQSVSTHVASISALYAVVRDSRLRAAAPDALAALGRPAGALEAWRFAFGVCHESARDAAIAYQSHRVTSAWVARHVQFTGAPPPTQPCVLVTIHHAHQRFGFLMLSERLPRLGLVANFVPLPPGEQRQDLPPAWNRRAALSQFLRRAFEERVYHPSRAARPGLELLRGGSLVLLPEFFPGGQSARIFERVVSVGEGPVWLAQRTGRPLVPFVVVPDGPHWRVWCGQPIEPSVPALAAALETCIRHAPAAWSGWRDWHAAPRAR